VNIFKHDNKIIVCLTKISLLIAHFCINFTAHRNIMK